MNRKRVFRKIVIDFSCIGLVGLAILVLIVHVKPYQRGFFCDDQSLMHPFLEDTVPVWLVGVVGLFLPVICILLTEAVLVKEKDYVILPGDIFTRTRRPYIERCYRIITVFVFGIAVTAFVTELGKYSLGRLRPHFLEVCQPNCTSANTFVTHSICKNNDLKKITQARLSFPSGHSSLAVYCMLYLVVYIQVRLHIPEYHLAKPILQLIACSLALITCLSRISDYKHHPTDVLGGALLGCVICVSIIGSLSGLVADSRSYQSLQNVSDRERNTYHLADSDEVITAASDDLNIMVN